ncbi:MAG: hypothetical protein E6H07_00135 [Bacteroidetes bacterium]|nr:MAG: hypothetical protein E6H07_00135 [Bacteroidota bacterium]
MIWGCGQDDTDQLQFRLEFIPLQAGLYLRFASVPLLSGSLWAEGILFGNDLGINLNLEEGIT